MKLRDCRRKSINLRMMFLTNRAMEREGRCRVARVMKSLFARSCKSHPGMVGLVGLAHRRTICGTALPWTATTPGLAAAIESCMVPPKRCCASLRVHFVLSHTVERRTRRGDMNRSEQMLMFLSFIAFSSGHAAGQVHIVVVRAGGAHGANAPVARRGSDSRQPNFRIIRSGAVGILGPQTLAGQRFCRGCAHKIPPILPRSDRDPSVRRRAEWCDRWQWETCQPCTRSARAAARWPSQLFRRRALFLR